MANQLELQMRRELGWDLIEASRPDDYLLVQFECPPPVQTPTSPASQGRSLPLPCRTPQR
ncbi:hypothetical protein [Parachitinimonas caeni]|uniref:Uncharacterized protein n=1 Tax=Parachitinimonas caeni TaxID=3031301 RepID=A0ABT7E2M4_9NEIS|nr:hypothetical protein [Parachitinimonas caeni]MDK2126294.1 hypothetical protein [Parachitinimonas caeni]